MLTLIVTDALPADLHAGEKTTLYLFYGNGCPHCAKEALFPGAVLLIDPSLFNNIFIGTGLLVLALSGSWLIIRITQWRKSRLVP